MLYVLVIVYIFYVVCINYFICSVRFISYLYICYVVRFVVFAGLRAGTLWTSAGWGWRKAKTKTNLRLFAETLNTKQIHI